MPSLFVFTRTSRLLVVLSIFLFFIGRTDAMAQGRGDTRRHRAPVNSIECPTNLADCPTAGCSSDNHHDPKLNERKNLFNIDVSNPTRVKIEEIRALPLHPAGYTAGGDRQALKNLPQTNIGEGTIVRTVGWLLTIRKGNPESCNCGLSAQEDTDNHMVIVTNATMNAHKFKLRRPATKEELSAMLAVREPESVTVEFTPRVRQHGHPDFTKPIVEPLLKSTPQAAVLVRITGPLMFDSEHAKPGKGLNRSTNWEIHPVGHFEYCPKNKTCTLESNANWIDLGEH
jgi:hypothetical protein